MIGIAEHQIIAFSHFQSRKQGTLRWFSNRTGSYTKQDQRTLNTIDYRDKDYFKSVNSLALIESREYK